MSCKYILLEFSLFINNRLKIIILWNKLVLNYLILNNKF